MPLSRPTLTADYATLLDMRRSTHAFSHQPISHEILSSLIVHSVSARLSPDGRASTRMHPSGGARFPIEVYPLVFNGSDEVPAGLYHYNVKHHALDVLWQRPFTKSDIGELFTYPWVRDASLAIVLTAAFSRSQNKYGERGYRYILLEAGHIGQNLYVTSAALGLACSAMGGSRDEAVEKLLDIDGVTESVVHSVVFG